MLGLSVVVATAIIFSGLLTIVIISYGSIDEGLETLKEASDERYERELEKERTKIEINNATIINNKLYINVTNTGDTTLNSSKYKIDIIFNGNIITNDAIENEMRINEGPNNLVWTPGSVLRIVVDVSSLQDTGKIVVITGNGIKAFSEVGDYEKPTLGIDLSDKTGETNSMVDFSIQAWDNVGVDRVILTYRFEGSSENNIQMNKNPNNVWSRNINIPINSNRNIFYHIIVQDEQGNQVREPENGEKIILIHDPIAPTSDGGSGDFSINNGTSFTIYANFSDNIDVTSAKIYHKRNNTGSWIGNEMIKGTDNDFTIDNSTMNINTTFDTTDYFYFVIAYDDNGNSVQYPATGGSFKIEVK